MGKHSLPGPAVRAPRVRHLAPLAKLLTLAAIIAGLVIGGDSLYSHQQAASMASLAASSASTQSSLEAQAALDALAGPASIPATAAPPAATSHHGHYLLRALAIRGATHLIRIR